MRIQEHGADEMGAHNGPGTAVMFYSCCRLRGLEVVDREEVMPDDGASKGGRGERTHGSLSNYIPVTLSHTGLVIFPDLLF